MKIVVTGGKGKAGYWIVRELTSSKDGKAAHDVVVFDQTGSADGPCCHYVAGDIRNEAHVREALAGADAVVHLAGVPRHGIAPNEETFRTNVLGAFNVYEAAWRLDIRRIVTTSSEAVLGWAPGAWTREAVPDYLPMDEDHPLHPQDSYGLSKQVVEAVASSYSAKSNLTTILLRPPRIVSPQELSALRKSRGIAPTQFALFNYIDARDLAVACRLALEQPLSGCMALFVGSGDSLASEPLSSLYPKLMPAIGDKARALTDSQASVSIEKAKRLLGWAPRYSWRHDQGLDE